MFCDYNLYFRVTDDTMALVGHRPKQKNALYAMALAEIQQRFGFGRNSRIGDPMYTDPETDDFRLMPKSAAIGMGEGGSNVGASR